jgi:hypothetical protein
MTGPNDNFDESLGAPAKLITALRELPQEQIFIPPTLDEAVLRAARKHLEPEEEKGFNWFRLMPWAVAVAMLALLLMLAQLFTSKSMKQRGPAFAREDLNHDGQVDILDAFALAKQIRSQSAAKSQLDLNGDGLVDERDVAVIAAQAVKLGKGGRS